MQLLGVLLMVQLLRLQRLLSLLLVLTRMLLVVNPEWTMALEMGGMQLLDQWVKLRLSEYLPVLFRVLFMYLGRGCGSRSDKNAIGSSTCWDAPGTVTRSGAGIDPKRGDGSPSRSRYGTGRI